MAWQDTAAAQLGRQAPAVVGYLSQVSASYDWSPWIILTAQQLNTTYPDHGWEDPGRGAVAAIAAQIIDNARQQDPAAAAAGFASVIPQLETIAGQQAASIQAEQATHGGKGLGALGVLGIIGGIAAFAASGGASALIDALAAGGETAAAVPLSTAAFVGDLPLAADTASLVSTGLQAASVAANLDTAAITTGMAADTAQNIAIEQLINGTVQAGDTTSSLWQALTSAVSNPTAATIKTAATAVKDALSPVTTALSAVQQFNKDVIQPITQPITSTITAIQAFIDTIHRDLKAGFSGLLRIPSDLSNALSSLDATWSRAFSQLDSANKSNITDLMVPGFMGAGAVKLGDMSAAVRTAFPDAVANFTPPPHFTLTPGTSIDDINKLIAELDNWIGSDVPWIKAITQALAGLVMGIIHITGDLAGLVEAALEEGNKVRGLTKFGTGDVQLLFQRGEISQGDAVEELRVQGYSATRAAALLSLTRSLPDTGRILDLYRRGYLVGPVAREMLTDQGWNAEDQDLLLQSTPAELDLGSLQELLRRGAVSLDAASVALQRQGFRMQDAVQMLELSTRLLGLSDLITREDRSELVAGGAGFTFLSQSPPESFTRSAAALGVDEVGAAVLWSNHWAMLPPQLAVQAYFRGYINREQLGVSLAAASLPVELHQNYIDLQRPLIPTRSVMTLMQRGTISGVDAMRILTERGFDQVNANYLIESVKEASKPSAAAVTSDLHGLSSSVILDLYDQHQLTTEEAAGLLKELGWSPEAVNSTLQFHDARTAGRDRAAAIELIIANAKAGALTFEQAQGQLAQLDMHGAEQDRALARLTNAVTQRTKLPSEAKLLSMWKHGMLDDAATLSALGSLGYSDAWAQLLIDLEGASGPKTAQPPAAA